MESKYDVANIEPTWSDGNVSAFLACSVDQTGTTQDPKLVVEHSAPAPIISSVDENNITTTGATIMWTTDLSSDSKVLYGTTTPVENSSPLSEITDASLVTNHSVNLSGLTSGVTYYYKVVSVTSNGGSATSTENSFTTSGGINLKVRKSSDESTSLDTVVSNDSELFLTLAANTSYIIDGVIFASSTATGPDIKIAFDAVSGSSMDIGFLAGSAATFRQGGWMEDETDSGVIPIAASEPTVIKISGTITTGSTTGDFVLRWAQNSSNSNNTTIMTGSYLRAEEI